MALWRTLHRIADEEAERLARAFMRNRGITANAYNTFRVEAALKAGRLDLAEAAAMGDRTFGARLAPDLLGILTRTTGAAGAATIESSFEVELHPHLNIANTYSIEWAKASSAALVREIDASTRDSIRTVVGTAFEQGWPPREAAKRIRDVIGLTRYQSRTLAMEFTRRQGSGDSPESLRKWWDRAYKKAVQRRAFVIARTETIRAANVGQHGVWMDASQAGLLDGKTVEREWIATPDDRLCDECMEMHGQRVGLEERFATPDGDEIDEPPLHPQCRCAQGIVEKSAEEALPFTFGPEGQGELFPDQVPKTWRDRASAEGEVPKGTTPPDYGDGYKPPFDVAHGAAQGIDRAVKELEGLYRLALEKARGWAREHGAPVAVTDADMAREEYARWLAATGGIGNIPPEFIGPNESPWISMPEDQRMEERLKVTKFEEDPLAALRVQEALNNLWSDNAYMRDLLRIHGRPPVFVEAADSPSRVANETAHTDTTLGTIFYYVDQRFWDLVTLDGPPKIRELNVIGPLGESLGKFPVVGPGVVHVSDGLEAVFRHEIGHLWSFAVDDATLEKIWELIPPDARKAMWALGDYAATDPHEFMAELWALSSNHELNRDDWKPVQIVLRDFLPAKSEPADVEWMWKIADLFREGVEKGSLKNWATRIGTNRGLLYTDTRTAHPIVEQIKAMDTRREIPFKFDAYKSPGLDLDASPEEIREAIEFSRSWARESGAPVLSLTWDEHRADVERWLDEKGITNDEKRAYFKERAEVVIGGSTTVNLERSDATMLRQILAIQDMVNEEFSRNPALREIARVFGLPPMVFAHNTLHENSVAWTNLATGIITFQPRADYSRFLSVGPLVANVATPMGPRRPSPLEIDGYAGVLRHELGHSLTAMLDPDDARAFNDLFPPLFAKGRQLIAENPNDNNIELFADLFWLVTHPEFDQTKWNPKFKGVEFVNDTWLVNAIDLLRQSLGRANPSKYGVENVAILSGLGTVQDPDLPFLAPKYADTSTLEKRDTRHEIATKLDPPPFAAGMDPEQALAEARSWAEEHGAPRIALSHEELFADKERWIREAPPGSAAERDWNAIGAHFNQTAFDTGKPVNPQHALEVQQAINDEFFTNPYMRELIRVHGAPPIGFGFLGGGIGGDAWAVSFKESGVIIVKEIGDTLWKRYRPASEGGWVVGKLTPNIERKVGDETVYDLAQGSTQIEGLAGLIRHEIGHVFAGALLPEDAQKLKDMIPTDYARRRVVGDHGSTSIAETFAELFWLGTHRDYHGRESWKPLDYQGSPIDAAWVHDSIDFMLEALSRGKMDDHGRVVRDPDNPRWWFGYGAEAEPWQMELFPTKEGGKGVGQTKRDILLDSFRESTKQEFIDARSAASERIVGGVPARVFLSPTSEAEFEARGTLTYLDSTGTVGFALAPIKNDEGEIIGYDLQNVFNAGQIKGGGSAAIIRAIEEVERLTGRLPSTSSRSTLTLDCYDGPLVEIYQDHGFVEVKRDKWNDEYAPKGIVKIEEFSEAVAQKRTEGPFELRAYHGTTAEFEDFDPAKGTLGVHFGTEGQAAFFANAELVTAEPPISTAIQGQRVFASILRIDKPLSLPDLGDWKPMEVIEALEKRREQDGLDATEAEVEALHQAVFAVMEKAVVWEEDPTKRQTFDQHKQHAYKMIRDFLMSHGYDSIIYYNEYEDQPNRATSVIALDPTKIRSAIGVPEEVYQGWDYDRLDRPDVVYMRYAGGGAKPRETYPTPVDPWVNDQLNMDRSEVLDDMLPENWYTERLIAWADHQRRVSDLDEVERPELSVDEDTGETNLRELLPEDHDLIESEVKRVQASMDESDVWMRVDENDFESVLTDERFLSQFEAGDSNGLHDPEYRAQVENGTLGHPLDLPDDERPVYGYISNSTEGESPAVEQYGSIRVRFKKSVDRHTTVTIGDSLNHFGGRDGPPPTGPGLLPTPKNAVTSDVLAGDMNEFGETSEFWPYVEAQILDGADLDDIKEVVFESASEAELFTERLTERGISHRIMGFTEEESKAEIAAAKEEREKSEIAEERRERGWKGAAAEVAEMKADVFAGVDVESVEKDLAARRAEAEKRADEIAVKIRDAEIRLRAMDAFDKAGIAAIDKQEAEIEDLYAQKEARVAVAASAKASIDALEVRKHEDANKERWELDAEREWRIVIHVVGTDDMKKHLADEVKALGVKAELLEDQIQRARERFAVLSTLVAEKRATPLEHGELHAVKDEWNSLAEQLEYAQERQTLATRFRSEMMEAVARTSLPPMESPPEEWAKVAEGWLAKLKEDRDLEEKEYKRREAEADRLREEAEKEERERYAFETALMESTTATVEEVTAAHKSASHRTDTERKIVAERAKDYEEAERRSPPGAPARVTAKELYEAAIEALHEATRREDMLLVAVKRAEKRAEGSLVAAGPTIPEPPGLVAEAPHELDLARSLEDIAAERAEATVTLAVTEYDIERVEAELRAERAKEEVDKIREESLQAARDYFNARRDELLARLDDLFVERDRTAEEEAAAYVLRFAKDYDLLILRGKLSEVIDRQRAEETTLGQLRLRAAAISQKLREQKASLAASQEAARLRAELTEIGRQRALVASTINGIMNLRAALEEKLLLRTQ